MDSHAKRQSRDSRAGTCCLQMMLVVAAALLGVAAAEVGLRLLRSAGLYTPKMLPGESDAYLKGSPYLFSVLRPHTSDVYGWTLDPQGFKARITVNSLGFRGPEFAPEKPPGVYRVFCLGGSSTFGYQGSIPGDEDTYPAQLQRVLRDRGHTRGIEVVNAGTPGWTLRNSLLNYITRVGWLAPDLLIVNHAANDVIWARTWDDVRMSPTWDPPAPYAESRLHRLGRKSWLFREVVDKAVDRRAARIPSKGAARDEPLEVMLAAYSRHLESLIILAQAQGVAVVLTSEPMWSPPHCDNRANADEKQICGPMEFYYPHLTEIGRQRSFEAIKTIQQRSAAAHGLQWIDVDARIPKSTQYFADFVHLTPAGTALQASVIADALAGRIRSRDGPDSPVTRAPARTK